MIIAATSSIRILIVRSQISNDIILVTVPGLNDLEPARPLSSRYWDADNRRLPAGLKNFGVNADRGSPGAVCSALHTIALERPSKGAAEKT